MDPLSITASIAGIVTIGCQTIGLINNACGELGNRPATLVGLSSETTVFCSVLGHLEKSLLAYGPAPDTENDSDLSSAISSCMETFKRISILLADLQPRKSPMKRAALTILWHGKMKEMTEMRNDLDRHKMTLLIALQSLQNKEKYGSFTFFREVANV
jgi:hypothetical protein